MDRKTGMRRKLLEVAAVGAGAATAFALTGCSACSGSGGPGCGNITYPAYDASGDAAGDARDSSLVGPVDTGSGDAPSDADASPGETGSAADAGQE